ncbi:MAG: porin family protein [Bacteroidota bacterium]|nr:porin family protein [Bacteroidota bacterium]
MKIFRIQIVNTIQRFAVITCFAGLSIFCKAQSSDFKPYFSFGTSHGVSFSNINFYPAVVQQQLMGYYGGIAANYVSEKSFGLQVELNYSQRGWKEQATAGAFQRRLNYFEMPVLTHFYLGNKFRWMLNFGPKIGYLLSESSQNAVASSSHEEYTMPIANKFDYGFCAGTGFELCVGSTSYTLEGRYSFGLSDIFPNSKKDTFGNSGNKFVSITLGVFLHFPARQH